MANRPCYRPLEKYVGYSTVESTPFTWAAGFAFSQKQKNTTIMCAHGVQTTPRSHSNYGIMPLKYQKGM